MVRYDPYPLELYSIGVGSQGFAVKHRDLAYGARPSCRYSVKLDPERKKYAREYGISHVIPPHGVERFQILLASDKSAVFKLAVRVIYDEDRAVNVPPTTIRIFNPNKLWYYDYIKDRWIGDSGQTPRAVLFGRELTEANDDSKEAEAQIRKSRADRLNELGWTLIEQGIDIEEGIRLAEKARGLLPEDPPILDTVGWGYFMSGAYENAVRVLADAARLAPNDEIIGQHLKRAREASSRQR